MLFWRVPDTCSMTCRTFQIHHGLNLSPSFCSKRFISTPNALHLAKSSLNVNLEDHKTNISTLEAAILAGNNNGFPAFYADHHIVPLPPGHRFPMDKYRTTRELLESDPSLKGIFSTYQSPMASEKELLRVHDPGYVKRILSGEITSQEERALGFPWSPILMHRSLASSGGTIAATHIVLQKLKTASGNIAGGTHHAFRGHGEGFCVFNDIALAAMAALEEYSSLCNASRPILIIDLDVHQGNGTAKIFEDDNRVITFSMQGENNYPWRTKMKSTYDIDLKDNTEDDEYLKILSNRLPYLFQKYKPSLVFFQAGVDALSEDSFGRLSLTRTGLLKRNNMVYTSCIQNRIPLVITMGGGYSKPSDASIHAHADVYRSAAYRYSTLKET